MFDPFTRIFGNRPRSHIQKHTSPVTEMVVYAHTYLWSLFAYYITETFNLINYDELCLTLSCAEWWIIQWRMNDTSNRERGNEPCNQICYHWGWLVLLGVVCGVGFLLEAPLLDGHLTLHVLECGYSQGGAGLSCLRSSCNRWFHWFSVVHKSIYCSKCVILNLHF